MTNHLTSVYADQDPTHPCFAVCQCSWLCRCPNHDAAIVAGRVHLESVLTDREHVLNTQLRRDRLRLTDAIETVVTLRASIDGAQHELDEITKAGAA